jgi:thiol-disulfide isomerase/thioredoxin
MEEEREKNSKKKKNDEDEKEWKQVVGGFVPKFLKRDADMKYPSVEMVNTIEDYKRVVVDEQNQIVVVRFFAPWCKSCKAAQPLFKKMVSHHSPSVKFVEVPLTKETAYIHEGLGVPSVPFGHIYHPEVGLVEEKKINKKVFKEFREALDSYVRGSCDIPMEEDQEDESVADDGFQ